MISTDPNRAVRRRSRRSPGIRLLKALVFIALLSGGAIGAALWWEDRPLREIESALGRREFSLALELADRFLKESPSQTRALDQKARALAGLGRWIDAERLFEQNGPVSTESQHAWAKALLHQQRWSEALPLLLELNRQLPSDADVLHEMASCQGQLGFFDQAIDAAERLTKIPAHGRRGRVLLGTLHYRRSNNRLAIQAWAPLFNEQSTFDDLQLTPGELLLAYGRVLLDDGRPAEALPRLEQAVVADASDDACLALAEARESLGNREGAVEMWAKVVARAPGNREAREGLARAALEKRNAREALEWLDPLLEKDGIRSSTAHLAQRAATLSGDKDSAARWEQRAVTLRERERKTTALEQALRDTPRSFWSLCIRAHRFASDGNLQQARLLADELLAQKPEETFVQQLVDALRNQRPLPSLDLIPIQQH
jgi:tetratricopeptide (TPR) repeat protein